jgi:hypothetical protein
MEQLEFPENALPLPVPEIANRDNQNIREGNICQP